jgi:hypothetical protein
MRIKIRILEPKIAKDIVEAFDLWVNPHRLAWAGTCNGTMVKTNNVGF